LSFVQTRFGMPTSIIPVQSRIGARYASVIDLTRWNSFPI
jgi:hypothetical protein